jgi:hypothetical protein
MRFLYSLLLLPFIGTAQLNPNFVAKSNFTYPRMQVSTEGMFGFEQDKKIGYMDKNGTVVVPPVYDYDSSVISSGNIPIFQNGYAKVLQNKKCGLIDKTGKLLIPLEHEYLTPYTGYGNFVLLTKTINGKKNYGVLTVQNKILLPAEYEDIRIDTGVILMKQNGKWGVADKTGKQLLPAEYTALTYSATDKLLLAEKGTQYGIIDLTGKWMFEKVKTVFTLYTPRYGMVLCKVSGKYGFLDLKGNEVIVTRYEGAYDFTSSGMAQVYKKKEGSSNIYLYGYIDKKGTELIPNKYEVLGGISQGLIVAKDPETNRYGYLDRTGKWIIQPVYLSALSFDNFGGAWVKMTDDKYHYINKAAKDFGTLDEKGSSTPVFGKDGLALFEDISYPYYLIDKTGKQLKKLDDIDVYYLAYEGMTPYKSKTNKKYGCFDLDGNKVIPDEYDGFAGYVDGVCRVQKIVNGKTLTGYINTKNKILIPIEYTSGNDFRDGWAVVKKDSLYKFVDINGNVKDPPRKYDELTGFRSGYALGKVKGQNNAPATYYYINKGLKEEFNVSYKEAYPFWDDVAVIKRDKEYELMNKKGEVFNSLGQVDYMNFSVEGILAIRENKKWGFINNRGDRVVSPRYDSCAVFSYGYAKVMKDKKWGIVDKAGSEIIEPKYENISPGDNGTFIFYEKGWGMMDKTGKILIPPVYYSMNPFYKDKAVARLSKSYTILKSPLAK